AGFSLAAILIVAGFLFGPDAEPGRIDRVSSAALTGYLIALVCLVIASRHDPLALAAFVVLIAATVAVSWHSESSVAAVPVAAVFTPIAMVAALYYRIAEFAQSAPFAGIALLLAALFATATETLSKRAPRPGLAGASAVFATGAIAALALALTMALEKGWLTV